MVVQYYVWKILAYLLDIVKQPSSFFDSFHDRRKIVVRKDHIGGFFGHITSIQIAIPTSACFSAGESFRPSPVITQNAFFLCMASKTLTFVVGLHRTEGRVSMASISASGNLSNSSADIIAILDWHLLQLY